MSILEAVTQKLAPRNYRATIKVYDTNIHGLDVVTVDVRTSKKYIMCSFARDNKMSNEHIADLVEHKVSSVLGGTSEEGR